MILRQKACNQVLFLVTKAKHDCSCRAKILALAFWWPLINKKNTHTISPQTHIVFIMTRSKKGLGRFQNSGRGNNQGRRRTTPCDYQGFNRNESHSKRNYFSLPVISISLPLNNSVINPPQLSSVFQQSSRSSHNTPRDNQCLNRNHRN